MERKKKMKGTAAEIIVHHAIWESTLPESVDIRMSSEITSTAFLLCIAFPEASFPTTSLSQ